MINIIGSLNLLENLQCAVLERMLVVIAQDCN